MGWMVSLSVVGRMVLGRLAHSAVLLVFSQHRQLHGEIHPRQSSVLADPNSDSHRGENPESLDLFEK